MTGATAHPPAEADPNATGTAGTPHPPAETDPTATGTAAITATRTAATPHPPAETDPTATGVALTTTDIRAAEGPVEHGSTGAAATSTAADSVANPPVEPSHSGASRPWLMRVAQLCTPKAGLAVAVVGIAIFLTARRGSGN